jgi:hypothetical protein
MSRTISGVFEFKDKLLAAIRRLKEAGIKDLEVRMPVPDHDILDAVDHKPTPVGWFTLLGGIAGMTTGFVGPAWAHSHWGNIIGGKPVISLPPFIVIMFELTILFGGVLTLIGLFLLCRIPSVGKLKTDRHFDPRCSEDHYALIVNIPDGKLDEAKGILSEEGAEVRI